MSNDRNPYIFSCQTLAHLPSFVEDSDGAIRLDLANEVEPSSCNRQGLGQMQDLFGSQTTNVFALLCLLRRDIAQEWWCMIGHIPMDEGRTGATNLREGGEVSAFPKGMPPQAVQFFDFAIAFGLGDGQEDQFDAQIQTQPHELPEDAWRFVATTEGGIVVELQKLRDSKGFPGLQRMRPDRLVAFVGGDRLRASAGVQIQGMKGVDLESVFEIPTGPIQSLQSARQHLQGFGKIHPFRLAGFGNQATFAQHALDRGECRERFVSTHFAQLAPDRSRADQADFLFC